MLYIETILMNGCQVWTISKQVQKNGDNTKCGSFGECYESHGLQRNQKKLLLEADTRSLIKQNIYQTMSFGRVMRRKKLQHLVTTGMIERGGGGGGGGGGVGGQCEKMLDGPTKRLKVGRVTEALKATRNRDG